MKLNAILEPVQKVSRHVVDDAPVQLVIMYVGDEASATVTVSTDITFKHGDLASEAVDDTINSGGNDAGVIDVSDANANTLGEVVDMINASPNWKAYLKDGIRADSSAGLLARAETTLVPEVTETPLYADTSTVLNLSVRIGSRNSVNGSEAVSAAEVNYIVCTNTFGSGTNLIQIYEVDESKKTETKLVEMAGGATTVEDEPLGNEGNIPYQVSKLGMHLVVRMIGSAACTGKMSASGSVARGA